MKELEIYSNEIFEKIKHVDEYGNEYWEARELMKAAEYSKWQKFEKIIYKSKISCKNSNVRINDHFTEVRKLSNCANNAQVNAVKSKINMRQLF